MIQEELIRRIAEEVVQRLDLFGDGQSPTDSTVSENHAIAQLQRQTPARIGVERAGARLRTQTLLKLRADHAQAKDSVWRDVDSELLRQMRLFTVKTACKDRGEYLTRPDLGRRFEKTEEEEIRHKCTPNPQVQIFLSDGLSSKAIDANAADILPALLDRLKDLNIKTGTPFFVQYGRVAAMDAVSEIVGAEVTCVLIGERPGLATANSMSAYIAYRAKVGMPESNRTVVSNIHAGGIPAAEAGAHIAGLLKKILEKKVSGVDFVE